MATQSLAATAGLVILVAGLFGGAAYAQTTVYPRGQYGAIITTPGSGPMGAYAFPGPGGSTTYVVPGQNNTQPRNWQQFSPSQQNQQRVFPSQQNWQQYRP